MCRHINTLTPFSSATGIPRLVRQQHRGSVDAGSRQLVVGWRRILRFVVGYERSQFILRWFVVRHHAFVPIGSRRLVWFLNF